MISLTRDQFKVSIIVIFNMSDTLIQDLVFKQLMIDGDNQLCFDCGK
jgi:hypothetical protein